MSPFIIQFRIAVRSRVIPVLFFAAIVCCVGSCHDGEGSGVRGGLDATGESGNGRKRPLAIFEQGLEYRRYVIAVHHDLLVQELGFYALSGSGEDSAFVDLEANGFRFFLIPIDKVEEVLGTLNPEPIHDSTWLGLVSSWISVAGGPVVSGTRILKIDGQDVSYNEGRFRLLVRSYPVITGQDGAAPFLRVELLPQWHHSPPMANLLPVNPQDRELAGQLFTELGGIVNLDGKKAFVIIGDDPANSWSDNERDGGGEEVSPPNEPGREGEASGVDFEPTIREDHIQGPNTMAIKTIGEEVLSSMGDGQRMVLVFIPHLSQRVKSTATYYDKR